MCKVQTCPALGETAATDKKSSPAPSARRENRRKHTSTQQCRESETSSCEIELNRQASVNFSECVIAFFEEIINAKNLPHRRDRRVWIVPPSWKPPAPSPCEARAGRGPGRGAPSIELAR